MRCYHIARKATGILLLSCLLSSVAQLQPGPLAAQGLAGWEDTGLRVDHNTWLCFEATRPGVILVGSQQGSSAYNWQTRRETKFSDRRFDSAKCAGDGSLYEPATGTSRPGFRFSLADPAGRAIERTPTHLAGDGTSQVYSLEQYSEEGQRTRLWASPDGGITWEQRAAGLEGDLLSLLVSQPDARAIYVLVALPGDRYDGLRDYVVYFSPDAGVNWERRFSGQARAGVFNDPGISFMPIASRATPVDTVQIGIGNGIPGSNSRTMMHLSTDGARSFSPLFEFSIQGYQMLAHANSGLLLLRAEDFGGKATLYSLASGDRASWQTRPLPGLAEGSQQYGYRAAPELRVADNEPGNVFVLTRVSPGAQNPPRSQELWHSTDGGITWRMIADNVDRYLVSPYAPLTLLGIQGDKVYVRTMAEGDATLTRPVLVNGVPGGSFAAATGHNLSGRFARYWQDHGGLPQFGYPRTEAFREVSATDGKVYTVQYFERNRFEYHPENAPPHDVLLGLLGKEISEPLRRTGHGAFNRFEDLGYPGARYFPQTGHNLRSSFLRYWSEHGGLAIYGFPISEEFEEVSPTDGKTYIVQYFERNRFEYHPENSPPHDVLLGLLGNDLLKRKGWLE